MCVFRMCNFHFSYFYRARAGVFLAHLFVKQPVASSASHRVASLRNATLIQGLAEGVPSPSPRPQPRPFRGALALFVVWHWGREY